MKPLSLILALAALSLSSCGSKEEATQKAAAEEQMKATDKQAEAMGAQAKADGKAIEAEGAQAEAEMKKDAEAAKAKKLATPAPAAPVQ